MDTPHAPCPATSELLTALIEAERRLTLLIEREQHKLLDVVARDNARAAIAKNKAIP